METVLILDVWLMQHHDGGAAMANGAASRVFGDTFSTVAEAAFMNSGQFRSYHAPTTAQPQQMQNGSPSPPNTVPYQSPGMLTRCEAEPKWTHQHHPQSLMPDGCSLCRRSAVRRNAATVQLHRGSRQT